MVCVCSLCGKKIEISKMHKDYLRLAKDPKAVFICNFCNDKVAVESKEKDKIKKGL